MNALIVLFKSVKLENEPKRILVPISMLLRAVVTMMGAAPELPVPPIVIVPDWTGNAEKAVINTLKRIRFLLFIFIDLLFILV